MQGVLLGLLAAKPFFRLYMEGFEDGCGNPIVPRSLVNWDGMEDGDLGL